MRVIWFLGDDPLLLLVGGAFSLRATVLARLRAVPRTGQSGDYSILANLKNSLNTFLCVFSLERKGQAALETDLLKDHHAHVQCRNLVLGLVFIIKLFNCTL